MYAIGLVIPKYVWLTKQQNPPNVPQLRVS